MTHRLREKAIKAVYDNYINKYEIIGRIGEGAYGVVRKAHERANPSVVVAVKTFKPKIQREGEGIPLTVCREINVRFS